MDKNYTIKRLKPDEYITISDLETGSAADSWIPYNGIGITKDGENIPVQTPFTVDSGCEIEVKYRENGAGWVKYLSVTPRRKYYMFLKWYIIILELLAIIFSIYEVNVCGNYMIEGSRSYNLLLPLMGTWLTLNMVILRNTKGFTKWVLTIFSYMLLLMSTAGFLTYIIALVIG